MYLAAPACHPDSRWYKAKMPRLVLCATTRREWRRFRSTPAIKRTTAMVLGALLALALATPAATAQSIQIPGFPANFPWFTNVPQAQTFEQFLANHPDDRRELADNPGLLYDPNCRAQHQQLQYFLQTHPDVWARLRSQGPGIYDSPFNQFLRNQPRIAADLRDNPELLYDANYRDAHPALDQYLANHPRVWANLNAQHNSGGTEQSQFGSTAQPETGYGAYDSQPMARRLLVASVQFGLGLAGSKPGRARKSPNPGPFSGC
jgi:hypothetical protein